MASDGGAPRDGDEVRRRLHVTLGAAALALGLCWLPLPLVNLVALQELRPHPFISWWSVGALGLVPFVQAYVLVEVAALAVPALRRRRGGSMADRGPLDAAAWAIGLAFAAIQARAISSDLAEISDLLGQPALQAGAFGTATVTLTLIAGSSVLALLARAVSRHGLGSGFAVVLVASGLADVPEFVLGLLRTSGPDVALLPAVLLPLVVAALAATAARPRPAGEIDVPVPTCGIVPLQVLTIAPALAALPGAFPWGGGALGEVLSGTAPGLSPFVPLALALVAGLVLARLFCPPGAVRRAWSRVGGAAAGEERDRDVDRALSTANRLSLVLVAGLAGLPFLSDALGLPLAFAPETTFRFVVLAAVALDVAAEARDRAALPALVPVHGLHQVWRAGPVQAALAAAGIPAVVRGRRFRALLHFFAPYASVEVWVPAHLADEARAICLAVTSDAPDEARAAGAARAPAPGA